MLVVRQIRTDTVVPKIPGCHFRPFAEVTPELLSQIDPEVIVSALIAPDFDAIDLARLLHDHGFAGRYRAVAAKLPNRRGVVAEVRAASPGLDFDVFVMGDVRRA